MWAMTPFGILMPAIRPPKTVKPGDSKTLQIRARRSKDLDILRARYMQRSLGATLHTPTFDYEYRAYCEPAAFGLAVAQMVMEIDYLKFKPTTESKFADNELHKCYNAIWGVVMAQLSTKGHQTEYWSKYLPADKDDLDADLDAPLYVSTPGIGTGYGWPMAGDTNRDWSTSDSEGGDSLDDILLGGDDDWAVEAAAEADRMAAELDALIESEPPERIDHSECGHSNSDAARSRCRARVLREHQAKVAEIRQLVEDSVAESKAAFTSSLPE